MSVIFWFRKDLRLQDNEALSFAAREPITPYYVLPKNFEALSGIRQHSLVESLKSLGRSLPSGLGVLDSLQELAEVAEKTGADRVIATRSFEPIGMLEQADVGEKLFAKGIALELVGSNYAVQPGTVRKDDGSPLKVYTPFYKRWLQTGWDSPFTLSVHSVNWLNPKNANQFPSTLKPTPFVVKAGEDYALSTWQRFQSLKLSNYAEDRNRTDLSGTSHLSHALAHGEIHPRTLLKSLGETPGEETFRKELAWREFYADVLFHNPHTATDYLNPIFAQMRYSTPDSHPEWLEAWREGKTGYPIVDAAMRQLSQTGWMHNRARMIVASFLIKDLHFEWQVGATHFEQSLSDFDLASNAHGWQWTAGCGTDASPYYRVFNPVLQGEKFDPNGDYVRKFIPELRHIPSGAVHKPWDLIDGYAHGYPTPIVDHAAERDEALRRLKELPKA